MGNNPFLRYQAIYAIQALQYVPDNETPAKYLFRHFVKATGDLVQVSRIVQMDFHGFAGGVKEILKNIDDIYKIGKSGLEDIIALKEDGKGLVNSLKEIFCSGKKHPWYICLCAAEDFVRNGQLMELNQCVCEAPSHGSYLFQWGICQLLGEIGVDPVWDETTRAQALELLCQMYMSSLRHNVRCWILTILNYISELKIVDPSDTSIEQSIKSLASTHSGPRVKET